MADLLYQDRVWRDAQGREWLLTEMKVSHRANTLAWMRRNAAALAFHDAMTMISGPFNACGDEAVAAQDVYLDYMASEPEEWLEEMPLVIRLAELVAADGEAAQGGWPWPEDETRRPRDGR